CEPSKTSPLFKMRIHDHIINKTKSRGDLYFALQMSLCSIAFVDHRVTHRHCTSTGTCYYKIFMVVSIQKNVQKISTPKCRAQPQLVATAEHHSVAMTDTFQIFVLHGILAIADRHQAHICTGNFSKSIEVVFAHLVGNDRSGCNDLDPH